MPQIQLLGAIHDPDTAQSKEAAAGSIASYAGQAADSCHGLRVAAGIVDGQLELEGELVLAGIEGVRSVGAGGAFVVVVWENLDQLVKDLVVLADEAARRPRWRTGARSDGIVAVVLGTCRAVPDSPSSLTTMEPICSLRGRFRMTLPETASRLV